MRIIKIYLNKVKSNKLIASFSLLASGSIIAQMITMLSSPITTRLYTPTELGKYTIIITALSIFGPVISLKYDMAIVMAEEEREVNALIKLSGLLTVVLSSLVSVFYSLFFLREDFPGYQILVIILFMSVLLVSYGLNNILIAHNNRYGLYKLISSVTVLKTLVNSLITLIGGILNLKVYGLLLAQLFSYFAGVSRQSQDTRKDFKKIIKISKGELMLASKKYYNQPIYNASAALFTTTVYSSINVFVKSVYSFEQLGLYSLSYKVLGIPFTVISANLARIFYDQAIKEKNKYGSYKEVFQRTLKILVITIIPLLVTLAIISPTVFSIVFGNDWIDAGYYVRYMTPMFAVRLIVDSLTTGFIISGKQHLELFYQIILFICEIVIFFISYYFTLQISTALIIISLLYVVIYGKMLIELFNLSKTMTEKI